VNFSSTKNKTACIVGSSGLVGKEVLNYLLQDNEYSTVYSLVRKPSGISNEKLKEIQIDFNSFPYTIPEIKNVDAAFCCLGTTMKTAGSKEAFKKVDFTYPLEFAKWAKSIGARRFLAISAMGADPTSKIFYNQVKGEVEQAIGKLGIPSVTFFRPSMLSGNREENRPGEKVALVIMNALSFLFIGPLKNYKAISVKKVAAAMLLHSKQDRSGVEVVLSGSMQDVINPI
jgi:uncharacterized protein YbjT (DUF2867 family)